MAKSNNERDVMIQGVRRLRAGVAPESVELRDFTWRLHDGAYRIAVRVLRKWCRDAEGRAVCVAERVCKRLIGSRFHRFDDHREFWPYVAKVVWSACTDEFRKESRRALLLAQPGHRAIRENPYAEPSVHIAREETRRMVRDLVQRLPKTCRVAVKLRKLRGLSRREAARRCNVSLQTMSNWTFEGMQRLEEWLRDSRADEAA